MANALAHTITAPGRAMRRLYDWTIQWSRSRHAPYALFGISFMESSFFPVPPDALLIPMVVARRERWLQHALICTLGSVLGALLGYAIGMFLFEAVGKPIAAMYNLHAQMETVGRHYQDNAFLTVLTAAFTPIPYKVITIAAGLFEVSLATLMIASAVGRASRFFLVAGLLRIFGKPIADTLERHFNIFSLVFMALLIGGFLALRFAL